MFQKEVRQHFLSIPAVGPSTVQRHELFMVATIELSTFPQLKAKLHSTSERPAEDCEAARTASTACHWYGSHPLSYPTYSQPIIEYTR
jgi:hypothetical protein